MTNSEFHEMVKNIWLTRKTKRKKNDVYIHLDAQNADGSTWNFFAFTHNLAYGRIISFAYVRRVLLFVRAYQFAITLDATQE